MSTATLPDVSPAPMKKKPAPRVTAETLAAKQRDISVSEFFAKNRHLLGFDNPRKALLTTVKEAVDNSLDACEEAGILPDITVIIEDLQPDRPPSAKSSRYRVTVVDNGPGIVKKQVEHIFGRLLYGSKFHRLKMSRGQQGIGISAAGMYGLITTGKPMMIQTRPHAGRKAHHIELAMNTKTNRAEITVDEETDDFPLQRLRDLPQVRSADTPILDPGDYQTGTSVTIELEGKYQRGRGSVDEFLELTAIANPHARITFLRPTRTTDEEEDVPLLRRKAAVEAATDGQTAPLPAQPEVTQELGPIVIFPRGVSDLPPETREIQPHPRGVELGTLIQMLKDFQEAEKGGSLYRFLQERFCRISASTASEFCEAAGVTSRTRVEDVEPAQVERLYKAFQETRLAPPPTDCLAPIGVQQLLKGMFKGVRAEFYAASSRSPDVYRGRPFLIEAAIAYGGELPGEDPARVIRFANRVPLLFQQSACSSFKAVVETNWRNYDLQQPKGGVPVGPLVILIHMASVWVPFTSESKEAIADYDEIRKEMKLALMECGRKLGAYLRKRARMKRESQRRDVFERYIGEITQAVHAINGVDAKRLYEALLAQAKRHTALADVHLDEHGRAVAEDDPADQEGVIIVESAGEPVRGGSKPDPFAVSRAEAARLKVAAMAKDSDQPKLIDDEPARTSRRTGDKARKSKDKAGKHVRGTRAGETTALPKPSSATPEAPKAADKQATKGQQEQPKPAKPRMRLVNGKVVPIDQPGLF